MSTKIVNLKDAVGRRLAHDITEVRPGEFKGAAFKSGHQVCDEDICHLERLGKNHLYEIDLEPGEMHENEAAATLAGALAGPGVVWENQPSEGKITLHAAFDGLLKVDTATLAAFNLVDEVMCATLHTNTLVEQGQLVAATRALPLVMDRTPVMRAAAMAGQGGGVVSVLRLKKARAGLVITGNEVAAGLIQDRFQPILEEKLERLGSVAAQVEIAPDDPRLIAKAITSKVESGCDLILLTGGMSVDPDDVTRKGAALAGADEVHYGSAVLPGAMFMVAYLGKIPLLGVPACGLFHRATALDLVLPRVLAGERVGKAELALLGHGGLCQSCPECAFPHCAFGKN